MKTRYWKRESITDGHIVALFKTVETESEISGYIYKNGKWEAYEPIVAKAGYDDDYECISASEANSIMKQM